MNTTPLIVDLDGTLLETDMLHESFISLVRANPFNLFRIPYWWALHGKAGVKQQLARRTDFNPSALPYNTDLLAWLKDQKATGRRLILCTATDETIATPIAHHLAIFDDIMASDGKTNLRGAHKADSLAARFGHAGFDYAGNSRTDMPVWQKARRAIVVNASTRLTQQASRQCEVEHIFPPQVKTLRLWGQTLRVHQWLKNLLLWVPLLAAHQISNPNQWVSVWVAFIAFSLCASAVYITNDLLDLESDRHHPRKCKRPFAAGKIPLWVGCVLAPLLLLFSFGVAQWINPTFVHWLGAYFLLTCAYSLRLKRMILIDCITLALLYTLRIVAGAAAVQITLSFWLLAFAIFLFLSLAFVKRYAELEVLRHHKPTQQTTCRGYFPQDAPLVQTLGVTSGYCAVMMLALYLNSEQVIMLYRTPQVVWAAVPILLFWIGWMWMQAHRGKMHDDPVVFALKDKTSLMAGAAFALVVVLGTFAFPS